MKIWVEYEDQGSHIARTMAGGIKGSVYLDLTQFGKDVIGNISSQLEDQGVHAVMKVEAVRAAKREFGGIAVIYGINVPAQFRGDNSTFIVKLDGSKRQHDKAMESVLEFFKSKKLLSPL